MNINQIHKLEASIASFEALMLQYYAEAPDAYQGAYAPTIAMLDRNIKSIKKQLRNLY